MGWKKGRHTTCKFYNRALPARPTPSLHPLPLLDSNLQSRPSLLLRFHVVSASIPGRFYVAFALLYCRFYVAFTSLFSQIVAANPPQPNLTH